ncbi:alpha/beta hydrolase [Ornithinimicrobium sp. Y1847]|uniref:alpha/beta hydrolase n=1 Tax=Ornithinimicrobium sp. Y1847 TaxID=3405419 RepID=UPI003B66DB21
MASTRMRTRFLATVTAAALLAACTPGGDDADQTTAPATGGENSTATATPGPDGSGSDDGDATTAPDASGSTAAPAAGDAPEGLEEFYGQTLEWENCESIFQCASLTVPLDYARPDGETIEIAVLRAPARGGQAQGSLVLNPGGPGGSGVDYAMMAGAVVSSEVRSAYDMVGFDPRGVGRSAPVTCFDDDRMDDLLGADPTPDDAAAEEAQQALMQDFAQSCLDNTGELLGHVSTPEAARDIDVLRAALGEDKLTYLGASYGTFLGTTYATLFPERVGRLVLDAAVDPHLTGLEMGLGQAEGFQRATRAYVEDCVASGSCPLGEDVDSALAQIPLLLESLSTDPLPVRGDKVTELTEGWGMYGIIVAMYAETFWPLLTQALEMAQNGDGTMLMFLANTYASRSSDGVYEGNSMQAIYAVNCLDRPVEQGDEVDLDSEEVLRQFEEVSPTWGRYLAGDGACQYWPVEATESIEDYSAAGADPIVVIGTTRDPATPYEWAQALAKELDSGVLVTYEGDGHTAYGRSNDCIKDAVDAYLLEGTVPEDGLTC